MMLPLSPARRFLREGKRIIWNVLRRGADVLKHTSAGSLVICLIFILTLSGALVPAHSIDELAGTSGGRFFKLKFGARAKAMGGAYTAEPGDLYATQWNPSSLLSMENKQLVFQHNKMLVDMKGQYLGIGPLRVISPKTRFHVFAGHFDKGDIQGTSETTSGAFLDFTGKFRASDLKLGFGLAHKLSERMGAGANFKILRSKIAGYATEAAGLDLGFQYRLRPDLRLGGALRNIGTDVEFVNQADPLPLTYGAGLAYDRNVNSYLNYRINADLRKPRDDAAGLHIGNEIIISRRLFLRLGYSSTDELDDGLAFGTGFRMAGIQVDYAYRTSGDYFDKRQSFSFKMNF